jgi:hypothetical protein
MVRFDPVRFTSVLSVPFDKATIPVRVTVAPVKTTVLAVVDKSFIVPEVATTWVDSAIAPISLANSAPVLSLITPVADATKNRVAVLPKLEIVLIREVPLTSRVFDGDTVLIPTAVVPANDINTLEIPFDKSSKLPVEDTCPVDAPDALASPFALNCIVVVPHTA